MGLKCIKDTNGQRARITSVSTLIMRTNSTTVEVLCYNYFKKSQDFGDQEKQLE